MEGYLLVSVPKRGEASWTLLKPQRYNEPELKHTGQSGKTAVFFGCGAFVLFACLVIKRFRGAANSAAKKLQRVMAGHTASLGG
jgi:hypothetical protein